MAADAAGETAAHPTMGNPAAVYCSKVMGYEYGVAGDDGQHGLCTLPDGQACDAWEFLEGKCGQGYSYCAQQGYGMRTVSDGQDAFSPEYAVCVTSEGAEVGPVTELSELAEKATGCGGQVGGPRDAARRRGGGTGTWPRRREAAARLLSTGGATRALMADTDQGSGGVRQLLGIRRGRHFGGGAQHRREQPRPGPGPVGAVSGL